MSTNFGYHLRKIARGEYGELSKIVEECEEMQDAAEQGNKVMVLVELSDLVGAIQGYLEKHHSSISLQDLEVMADATRRAFEAGVR